MSLFIKILIAAVVAFICKYILEALGIPAPWPIIAALLIFLAAAFGSGSWRF